MTELLPLAVVGSLIFILWAHSSGQKLKVRIERLARIRLKGGPDANISYMNLHGRRSIRKITIESIKPHGNDWLVIAWCHKKKGFFIFTVSRIAWCYDLKQNKEVADVYDFFARRGRAEAKAARLVQEQFEQQAHRTAA